MFERCMYFNVNALSRKLNQRWSEAFSQFDLPPSHAYLLRLILDEPGQTQQMLAENLQLEKSTITRFIDKLEAKKLVRRKQAYDNQRLNTVYPTKKAEAIKADMEILGNQLYASMCDALGKSTVKQVVTSIRALNSKL